MKSSGSMSELRAKPRCRRRSYIHTYIHTDIQWCICKGRDTSERFRVVLQSPVQVVRDAAAVLHFSGHILQSRPVCMYVCMYVCISVGSKVDMHVCLYVRTNVYQWHPKLICMYVSMYECIYTHTQSY